MSFCFRQFLDVNLVGYKMVCWHAGRSNPIKLFSAHRVQVCIPDHNVLVLASCEQEVTKWGKSGGRGGAFVAEDCVQDLPLPQIPYFDCGVV